MIDALSRLLMGVILLIIAMGLVACTSPYFYGSNSLRLTSSCVLNC